jgi:hypothetical protein
VWEKACTQAMSEEPAYSRVIYKEIITIFGTNLRHNFPYILHTKKAAVCSKGTGVRKGFLVAACYLAFSLLEHPH